MKMLTHFLEKNEKLSVWEILGIEKGTLLWPAPAHMCMLAALEPSRSIDGYKELHNIEGADVWEKARADVHRQQMVRRNIPFLCPSPRMQHFH